MTHSHFVLVKDVLCKLHYHNLIMCTCKVIAISILFVVNTYFIHKLQLQFYIMGCHSMIFWECTWFLWLSLGT